MSNKKFKIDGSLEVAEEIVVKNISVSGTTTTVDHETLKVEDNLIVLNSGELDLSTDPSTPAGLVICTGDTEKPAYGIAYDPSDDTVKLGIGVVKLDGSFEFDKTAGEGAAVAVRSSELQDGDLVVYSEDGHKLVPAPQMDYNQNDESASDYIKNRPCYSTEVEVTPKRTYTFDGNLEGKEFVDFGDGNCFIKVSDDIITNSDELLGSTIKINRNGVIEEVVVTEEDLDTTGSGFFGVAYVAIVYDVTQLSADAPPFPSNGIYFAYESTQNAYVSEFIIPAVMAEEVKQLDEKYLPDGIATEEYVDGLIAVNKEYADDTFVAKDTISSNGLYGKSAGNEYFYAISQGMTGDTVARRTDYGGLRCVTKYENDAATKSYVDGLPSNSKTESGAEYYKVYAKDDLSDQAWKIFTPGSFKMVSSDWGYATDWTPSQMIHSITQADGTSLTKIFEFPTNSGTLATTDDIETEINNVLADVKNIQFLRQEIPAGGEVTLLPNSLYMISVSGNNVCLKDSSDLTDKGQFLIVFCADIGTAGPDKFAVMGMIYGGGLSIDTFTVVATNGVTKLKNYNSSSTAGYNLLVKQ